MIVLDASAVVALVRDDEPVALRIGTVVANAPQAHAPELLDVEVTSALRRALLRGRLSEPAAEAGLVSLRALPVQRWRHVSLLSRIWDLRHGLTAYDAAYLALAEALGASLLTLDAGLADVARRSVEVVSP